MASLFLLEEATEELHLEVFSAPVIQAAAIATALHYRMRERSRQRSGRFAQPRQRIQVANVYDGMGPQIFRRAFHMSWDGFWRLHSILFPHISSAIDEPSVYERKGGRDSGRYLLPPIPNGPITTSICLGAALHYFAGGSPCDVMCMFGIAYSEVLSSVWIVVDAVNKCPQFHISYPETLAEQRKIAAGFEAYTWHLELCRSNRWDFELDPKTKLEGDKEGRHWPQEVLMWLEAQVRFELSGNLGLSRSHN
ncbi:LOW QUALITY PROTEIN: hypothetical protein ACHAW5_010663 [Stephanodiscus triporus]|uniref:Uncharacterized protein n=1 Tax=Stephanodiscus triporus TaxID=2934178 RepID=A0ABD3NLE1_9STRA